jgi:hypothetical protein
VPPKPHRLLLDRMSGYADDAAAYLRRRRQRRRPFARVCGPGGRAEAYPRESEHGRGLFEAAESLIDVAPRGRSRVVDPPARS